MRPMLAEMDFVTCLRLSFLAAAAAILLIDSIPLLRDRFINYGSRTVPANEKQSSSTSTAASSAPADRDSSRLGRFLDYAAGCRVPHSYFTHFYVFALANLAFWSQQVLVHGSALQALARVYPPGPSAPSQPAAALSRLAVGWTMLYLQAGRRLYECVALTPRKRSPPSRMWIGHYLLGMAFYAALPLAALAEYVPHVLRAPRPKLAAFFVEPDTGRPALLHTAPSLRTAVLVPLLMLLAGVQHDAHAYLAGLRDYVVPRHFLFARLVAPHYTAEVAIYFVLALLLAPVGATLNLTMASAAVFVAVNLGVTARRSLQWYRAKFGEHAVSGRFVLVPFMW